MTNDFYVYAHRAVSQRDKGDIFYIGKGRKNRAWAQGDRNIHWRSIVSKHGYTVEILAKDLTEEQAFDLEKSFIVICGQEVLCNMTMGGGGIAGYKHTAETKEIIRLTHQGAKRSPETLVKMSAWQKGRKLSDEVHAKMFGRVHTEEGRKRISEAKKGKPAPYKMKKVQCSNGMIFDSQKHAVKWLGRDETATANISSVCRGLRKSAYGFTWSYA